MGSLSRRLVATALCLAWNGGAYAQFLPLLPGGGGFSVEFGGGHGGPRWHGAPKMSSPLKSDSSKHLAPRLESEKRGFRREASKPPPAVPRASVTTKFAKPTHTPEVRETVRESPTAPAPAKTPDVAKKPGTNPKSIETPELVRKPEATPSPNPTLQKEVPPTPDKTPELITTDGGPAPTPPGTPLTPVATPSEAQTPTQSDTTPTPIPTTQAAQTDTDDQTGQCASNPDGQSHPVSHAPGANTYICGPDVTANVFATLRAIELTYLSASNEVRQEACSNLYGLAALRAWDIYELSPAMAPDPSNDLFGSPKSGETTCETPRGWLRYAGNGIWKPFQPWFTAYSGCAVPRPNVVCAATVQFLNTCQHAQVVNYVMWGLLNKLCGYTLDRAVTVSSARTGSGDPDLVAAQNDMTSIGYDYGKFQRAAAAFPNAAPAYQPQTFKICALACTAKIPPGSFAFSWVGLPYVSNPKPRPAPGAPGGVAPVGQGSVTNK